MKMQGKGFQLRCAAGKYWLLDMEQKGFAYQPPRCLNESGAYLFALSQKGLSREAIACRLCSEFGLGQEEARQDVDGFFSQLEEY
jgi:hypothetical protein